MPAQNAALLGPARPSPQASTPHPGTSHPGTPQPGNPQSVIPHRREIRSWLSGLAGRSTLQALRLLILDLALYAGSLALVVFSRTLWLQFAGGILAGLITGRLFILGHDACHQSLTPHRGLNRLIGRLAFLPSLTPYSLWDVGHNLVHHGYTNLKGFDFVWAPLSVAEYRALPAWRRTLERVYRSGWAPGLYYLIEMWWLRMYFPRARMLGARRAVFTWDCLLVTAWAACWAGGLIWLAAWTGQAATTLLLTGMMLPFLVWNSLIGFVVYVHHTHAKVAWHDDKAIWARAQPFVSTTVHLSFRHGFGTALHHIMEHTAHHVDMGIPLYRLRQAQALLEARMPDSIVVQPFSWRWYFATARTCQLYDFGEQQWLDFQGRPVQRETTSSCA